MPFVKVEDLEYSAIEFFKQKALKKKRIDSDILDEDNKGLIEKLHLMEGDYLKRASVLLFYKDPEKLKLAIDLSRITFPFLFFICLASFFAAILNSYNKFAVAAAAPIILNVILIGSLFISQWLNISDVLTLSYAVSFAGFLQLLILLFFVRKIFKPILSMKIKINEEIKFFFRKLLPSIFSSGVTQINILVGTIIASFQAGAVSYLYYADRVYQINLAVAGIAVGTVMLPELSRYIKNNN